jgi:hypothetical protein
MYYSLKFWRLEEANQSYFLPFNEEFRYINKRYLDFNEKSTELG